MFSFTGWLSKFKEFMSKSGDRPFFSTLEAVAVPVAFLSSRFFSSLCVLRRVAFEGLVLSTILKWGWKWGVEVGSSKFDLTNGL